MNAKKTQPKLAWFHCFSGIAGDMALGALIDAGADLKAIKKICAKLNLLDWDITATPTQRNGIAATKVEVIQNKTATQKAEHRKAADILELVKTADLPNSIKQKSLAAFTALAEAEGKLHNQPPEEVHFHEVGGVDAIIDIVGTMAALDNLEVQTVCASPVAHGTGTIQCEHGAMPNPPPAVVELLKSAISSGAPSYGVDVPYELTTPTGAALLKVLVEDFTALPEMEIIANGFGAGTREFKQLPNLTQVIIGTPTNIDASNKGQPVVLIETNLDDITGEVLADTISRLIAAGAHDAWATPIIMKKGRPAHTLSALADPADFPTIKETMITATGTLGVRTQTLNRFPQPRSTESIQIDGHTVRIKIGSGTNQTTTKTAKPEYDDIQKVADATGRSLNEIKEEAVRKWREAQNE